MTHNLSFCCHADMTTKGLGLGLRLGLGLGLGLRLGSAKVEVLLNTIGFYLQ
jgi:transketolase N-terminal domain/subunit